MEESPGKNTPAIHACRTGRGEASPPCRVVAGRDRSSAVRGRDRWSGPCGPVGEPPRWGGQLLVIPPSAGDASCPVHAWQRVALGGSWDVGGLLAPRWARRRGSAPATWSAHWLRHPSRGRWPPWGRRPATAAPRGDGGVHGQSAWRPLHAPVVDRLRDEVCSMSWQHAVGRSPRTAGWWLLGRSPGEGRAGRDGCAGIARAQPAGGRRASALGAGRSATAERGPHASPASAPVCASHGL